MPNRPDKQNTTPTEHFSIDRFCDVIRAELLPFLLVLHVKHWLVVSVHHLNQQNNISCYCSPPESTKQHQDTLYGL